MTKTFEEYLKESFKRNFSGDDIETQFEFWLECLSVGELIDYADIYGQYIILEMQKALLNNK